MKDKQAKYPQLRFKGFTDPWEQRTLGQTTTKAKSYSLSRDVERDHETGYRYIHYGDIHTGVADIVTEHTKLPNIEPANYDELRVNDLVVADASEDYQGIAEPAVVVGLPTHLVAGLHTITLRPSSASSLYLYYLLHTDSFKHFGYQMGTGLKVFGISWSNLSKFTFMIPSRPEQEMIVKLIESIDNLIAVSQRKLDFLKEQKKGYLQKMFPKNGAKVPELRFAGFADDWEQHKLRDLLNKNSEKNKNLSVINVESVSNKTGFTKQTDQFEDYSVASADLSNYYVIREKQFAYNPSRINVGSIAYKDLGDEISVVSPLYVSFSTKKVLNDGFLWNWFKTASFDAQRQRLSEGGVRDTLSFNQLSEMNTMFPTYPEQEKIASFFKQLDNTIALHQRKLDLLKEQKKGFLQNMFV